MSWSSYGKVTVSDDEMPFHRIVDFDDFEDSPQIGYGEEESKEQIGAAQEAVDILLSYGDFGNGTFLVRLNGHANPDHQPTDNWSADSVTINVQKLS